MDSASFAHLSQEGAPFCWYCGGELAPSSAKLGRCVECGTDWQRVYTQDCPSCVGGWVNLHHPDVYSVGEKSGMGEYAEGYGWCDSCDAHVSYVWTRVPTSRPVPYLNLRVAHGRAVERAICGDPEELLWAS